MIPVLEVSQLSKHYGPIKAVDQLDLTVQRGQVFGILGPNGSGKTTTLGMILGIILPRSGAYKWFGGLHEVQARQRIGAILETPNFYPYLNADDNLRIIAHIKGVKDVPYDYLLDLVKLRHRRHSPFRTYSLGMKQRLAIAGALVGDPEVLIFDEPTNGLDPEGIAEVRETLIEIANQGKTVIMASHILDEVEKICSHVGIIKNGSLLATGPVGSIINDDIEIEIASADMGRLANWLENLPFVHAINTENHLIRITIEKEKSAAELNQLAFQEGIALSHLVSKKRSLEQEFLEITRDA